MRLKKQRLQRFTTSLITNDSANVPSDIPGKLLARRELANQVFTKKHKRHAEFTQKQMRQSTLASGKSMPEQVGWS